MNTTCRTARFGPYELDVRSGELRKLGTRVKMGEQAFQILCMLLENPNEMVTREQLRSRLWPQDTFVDFDHGLNSAVQRLRDCLSDSAERPRWIETVPRRGYRLIGQVEWSENRSAANGATPPSLDSKANGSSDSPPIANLGNAVAKHFSLKLLLFGAVLVGGILLAFKSTTGVSEPRVLRFRRLTISRGRKVCPYSAGNFVYFNQQDEPNGSRKLMQLPASGGEASEIRTPLGEVLLSDISVDGSKLLLATGNTFERDLWIYPVQGKNPQHVENIHAHDATFSADAREILYANSNALFVVKADGTGDQKLLTASGFSGLAQFVARWQTRRYRCHSRLQPQWRPSGSIDRWQQPSSNSLGQGRLVLRFMEFGWQVFRLLLEAAGRGRILGAARETKLVLESREHAGALSAERVLDVCGIVARFGNQIYVTGERPEAELVRYDARSRHFQSALGGISAEYVSFSRDGRWVAHSSFPEGDLWRARVDGTEKLKLASGMFVLSVGWSPDGTQISFVAKQPESALYVISANGGNPQRLPSGDAPVLNASWSPDGSTLVIGEWVATQAPVLRMLDLRSKQLHVLPGSEGLIHPVWSPDGKYIAAASAQGRKGTDRCMRFVLSNGLPCLSAALVLGRTTAMLSFARAMPNLPYACS